MAQGRWHMARKQNYFHVCSAKLYGILKGKNGALVTSVCYVMEFTIFSLFILATKCVLFYVRAGEKKQALALANETDCLLCDVRTEAEETVV
jgi:hypothetical protein